LEKKIEKNEEEKKGLDYDDLNSTHELKLENPSKRNGPTSFKGKLIDKLVL